MDINENRHGFVEIPSILPQRKKNTPRTAHEFV